MSQRAWIGGICVVLLVVAGGVAWWQTRPDGEQQVVLSGDTETLFGGTATALGDLGELMPERRPSMFVDLPWVLAASGTDFEAGQTETLLAVSDDEGESFRSVEFTEPLAYPNAVIHGDRAVLVGYRCERPSDGDSVCEHAAAEQLAFEIDLASGEAEPVEPAPIEGTIYQAVGAVGERSVFFAQTDAGEQMVTREPDGTWTVTAAPADASSVCAVGEVLVAVTSSAPLATGSTAPPAGDAGSPVTVPGGSEMPEVGQGEPLWAAVVSEDGGATWSAPVPFTSRLERDFSFVLGVTCGPRYVMANTAQFAAFDPQAQRWQPVDTPAELQGAFAPGGPAAWAGPDRFITWTMSSATGPPPTAGGADDSTELPDRQARVVEVNGIGTPDAAARTQATIDVTTSRPSGSLSPSAQAAGFVLEVGDGAVLGRVQ